MQSGPPFGNHIPMIPFVHNNGYFPQAQRVGSGPPMYGVSNVFMRPMNAQQALGVNAPNSNQFSQPPQNRNFSLYIGRLSKELSDELIQQILNFCGGVKKWKRVKGTFGFAEFTYAEGALRAHTILNGLRISDTKIMVNIEADNLKQLKQFEKDLENGHEPLRQKGRANLPTIQAELKKRNEEALDRINKLIKDRDLAPTKAARSPSRSRSTPPREDSDRKNREKTRQRSRSRDRRRSEPAPPETLADLVKLVPKESKECLSREIDWDLVHRTGLVENKMRDWIDNRLKEYLGGQEDIELTNFVVGLLAKHSSPQKIISELAVVLVEDSKKFVVKMWRRLIFEILKIKYGISDK